MFNSAIGAANQAERSGRTPLFQLPTEAQPPIGIYPEFIDGYGILILPTTGRYMQIPYRCMLPKGVKHLLATGRAIGGDRISHAATRNMACCAVAGQGAGIAAALSVKDGVGLEAVSMAAVQRELGRQGVRYL